MATHSVELSSTEEEDDEGKEPRFEGYKPNTYRAVVYGFLCLLSGGVLLFYSCLHRHRLVKWTHVKCDFGQATCVIIYSRKDKAEPAVETVIKRATKSPTLASFRNKKCYTLDSIGNGLDFHNEWQEMAYSKYFQHKFRKYCVVQNTVIPVHRQRGRDVLVKDYFDDKNGLTNSMHHDLHRLYGDNSICIPKRSYLGTILRLTANPFSFFQLFAILLWYFQEKYILSGFLLFSALFCLLLTTILTKKEQDRIKNLVAGSMKVRVWRNSGKEGVEMTVESHDLVPGDLISVEHGVTFPCDAILVNGTCVVNESQLTGDGLPILKVSSPTLEEFKQRGATEVDCKHMLFSGCQVLQTTASASSTVDHIQAVVVRTGFNTMLGDLLRTPALLERIRYQAYCDYFKFILLLEVVAVAVSLYAFFNHFHMHMYFKQFLSSFLSIIVFIVPPHLPVALVLSMLFVWINLKRTAKILCADTSSIDVAGLVECFCFDKTGTMTDANVILLEVVEASFERGLVPINKRSCLGSRDLLRCMACCHSLRISEAGKVVGDFLEKEMLLCVNGKLNAADGEKRIVDFLDKEHGETQFEIQTVFPFESSLGRMSCVAVNSVDGSRYGFSKGAPEVIAQLCTDSSLPVDLSACVKSYAEQGCRVIALAGKPLSQATSDNVTRSEVESELHFYGLLVFSNLCKPETRPTILELRRANIRTMMVTGDHISTAMHVAMECGMIDNLGSIYEVRRGQGNTVEHFRRVVGEDESYAVSADKVLVSSRAAVTGDVLQFLREHHSDVYEWVLLKGIVFARMSPNQKTELMLELKSLDYCVAMCGDGVNDCGALKAADVGISLSEEAEASVASPFRSQIQNISCCTSLLKSGRDALVTKTTLFSVLMACSLLQSLNLMLLSIVRSNLSDDGELFHYFALLIPLTITIIIPRPAFKLSHRKPRFPLFRLDLIVTLLLVIGVLFMSSFVSFTYVRGTSWYHKPLRFYNEGMEREYRFYAYEHTTIFGVLAMQYVILYVILYVGQPHREPLHRNCLHVVIATTSFAVGLIVVMFPWSGLRSAFMLLNIPHLLNRLYIALFVMASGILAYGISYFGTNSRYCKKGFKCLRRKKESKKRYKRLKSPVVTLESVRERTSPLPC